MNRRPPLTCKRRGCSASRERGQILCTTCWREVPYQARDRYLRARRRHHTQIAGTVARDILGFLGRKPEQTPPTQAFAQIAALTGDRDQLEPAE